MNHPSKWALITGASQGIGKACAELLAQKGLGVVLVARNAQKLQEVSNTIKTQGGTARWMAIDLTRPQAAPALSQKIQEWAIPLNILILNAGQAEVGPILEMPVPKWRQLFELNVFASIALLQALLPSMHRPTHIIFMNSIAGREAFPQWGAYSASKFALRAVADALRAELGGQNVKVTSIFPSSTDTPLQDALGLGWDRNKMLKPEAVAQAVWTAIHTDDDTALNEMVLEHVKGRF